MGRGSGSLSSSGFAHAKLSNKERLEIKAYVVEEITCILRICTVGINDLLDENRNCILLILALHYLEQMKA